MIDKFVGNLAAVTNLIDSENIYRGNYSNITKENLTIYLKKMFELKPTTILLGEAPGHRGCKLTGIPFTSERILKENKFFRDEKFKFINDPQRLQSENSATIVWNELSKYTLIPLIWNIYPFHPHLPNNLKSNRTPNFSELQIGKDILLELLMIFRIDNILAVGRSPESQLNDLNINFKYIRHPSFGGKSKFINGLETELK